MVKCFFSTTEELGENYDKLSCERRKRADRFKRAEKKSLSVAAGYLLEKTLEELFGIPAGTAEYLVGEYGKPMLAQKPELRFNLSHSGNMVMLAVETDTNEGACSFLGCDVERIREIDFDIAERFFTAGESDYVKKHLAQGTLTGQKAFFRLWTLKESFIKALGRGLSLPLSEFEIYFDDNDMPRVRQNAVQETISFKEFFDLPGYCAAVCIGTKGIGDFTLWQ